MENLLGKLGLVLIFILATNSFALHDVSQFLDDLGDEKGNGGDGVVCYDEQNKIKSVQLLDHYEAKALYGFEMDLGNNGDYRERMRFILKNLLKFDPSRSVQYSLSAENFEQEALFLPGVNLVDIPDSKHLIIPKECKVEQVVIQQEPTLHNQKRYTVSKDLWDLMDANSKAGLVLHEIIFKEAIENGQENSVRARYFNALISAKGFQGQTKEYYSERLKETEFKLAIGCVSYPRLQGINLKKVSFDEQMNIKGDVCEAEKWRLKNGKTFLLADEYPTVYFYPSGELLRFNPGQQPGWIRWDVKLGFLPLFQLTARRVVLSKEGALKEASINSVEGSLYYPPKCHIPTRGLDQISIEEEQVKFNLVLYDGDDNALCIPNLG